MTSFLPSFLPLGIFLTLLCVAYVLFRLDSRRRLLRGATAEEERRDGFNTWLRNRIPYVAVSMAVVFATLSTLGSRELRAALTELSKSTSQIDSAVAEVTKATGQVSKAVSDVRGAVHEIQDTLHQNLTDFPQVYNRAVDMLREIENDDTSEFVMAAYWLQFGADIYPSSENTFFSLLKERLRRRRSTSMVILSYNSADIEKSCLGGFLRSLSHYMVSPGMPALAPERVASFHTQIISEIQDQVLPLLDRASPCRLIQQDDLAAIFFLSRTKTGEKRALLFLGNTYMLENNLTQGGFFTADPRQVAVVESFFRYVTKIEDVWQR